MAEMAPLWASVFCIAITLSGKHKIKHTMICITFFALNIRVMIQARSHGPMSVSNLSAVVKHLTFPL